MDDVVVVDDLIVTAVGAGPTTRERQKVGAAEEHLEPVVVEAHTEPVADEARRDGVEHLAQPEPSRGGDVDRHVLVVAGPPLRQAPKGDPLALDPLAVAGVQEPDDPVHEGR